MLRFAILCALKVYKESTFCLWAENWLGGKDWSAETIAGVIKVADRAIKAAVWAAEAAEAAGEAAGAADRATEIAVWAAEAVAWTAEAVAKVALAVEANGDKLDFKVVVLKAITDEAQTPAFYEIEDGE